MGKCSFVNEENSNALAWECSLTGKDPGPEVVNAYCSSEKTCEYCPVRGGDDRILNPDPLTEEICDEIISSVTAIIDSSVNALSSGLSAVFEPAAGTGYEFLDDSLSDAASRYIQIPVFNGDFVSIVKTDAEKNRAQSLEESLNGIFSRMQPADFAPMPSGSRNSVFKVDSEIFTRLTSETETAMDMMSSYINAEVGCTEKYAQPVKNRLGELDREVFEYLQGIRYSVMDVQRVFESGVSDSLSGTGGLSSYFGTDFRWPQSR